MAFAVSTVIAAVGVGIAGVGLYESISSQKKAANAQADAARDQAAIAGLQSQNVDVQQEQLHLQTQQQQLQIQTNKSTIEQQSQADALRQQAAELDATRRRRDAIRQGIVARSQSLVNATNQGASAPGSTAIAQSGADISGQVNNNVLGINQNIGISEKLFQINKNITSLSLNAQDQNSAYVNRSEVLQNDVLGRQKQIYALGGDASSNYAQAAISSGNAALGQGLYSLGSTVANSYPTINRLTQYFGSASTASTGNNYGYTASTYGNGET